MAAERPAGEKSLLLLYSELSLFCSLSEFAKFCETKASSAASPMEMKDAKSSLFSAPPQKLENLKWFLLRRAKMAINPWEKKDATNDDGKIRFEIAISQS